MLDGKRVTCAEVDLLYINLTKDLTGTAGKTRDAADGVTLDMFGRALHAMAARLCPAAKTGVDAVFQVLEDCTRGRGSGCCSTRRRVLRPFRARLQDTLASYP